MDKIFNIFRSAVVKAGAPGVLSNDLKISSAGRLETYYAPFEHINTKARVVLVGITPGQSQAVAALQEFQRQIAHGASDEDALLAAKETASFAGGMRSALINMLDHVGVGNALGIAGCEALFSTSRHLVHYTSALRYPVLRDGKNYSGTPAISKTPYLLGMVDEWLAEEAKRLPDALWIPLGREPTAALQHLVNRRVLSASKVLSGLPHPSGANAERISYFLGRKAKESLSVKTNAAALDAAFDSISRKLAASF